MVKSKLAPTASASLSSSLSTASTQSAVSNVAGNGERKPSQALLEAKRRARSMLKSQSNGSHTMQETVTDIFQNVSVSWDCVRIYQLIFDSLFFLMPPGCQCQEHAARSYGAHLWWIDEPASMSLGWNSSGTPRTLYAHNGKVTRWNTASWPWNSIRLPYPYISTGVANWTLSSVACSCHHEWPQKLKSLNCIRRRITSALRAQRAWTMKSPWRN